MMLLLLLPPFLLLLLLDLFSNTGNVDGSTMLVQRLPLTQARVRVSSTRFWPIMLPEFGIDNDSSTFVHSGRQPDENGFYWYTLLLPRPIKLYSLRVVKGDFPLKECAQSLDIAWKYFGSMNITRNGEPCLHWKTVPNYRERFDDSYKNYCRSEFDPFCPIKSGTDHCDVPICTRLRAITNTNFEVWMSSNADVFHQNFDKNNFKLCGKASSRQTSVECYDTNMYTTTITILWRTQFHFSEINVFEIFTNQSKNMTSNKVLITLTTFLPCVLICIVSFLIFYTIRRTKSKSSRIAKSNSEDKMSKSLHLDENNADGKRKHVDAYCDLMKENTLDANTSDQSFVSSKQNALRLV